MKIIIIILFLMIFGLTSCSYKLQFNTSVSPSSELESIKTLAIGDVQLIHSKEVSLLDNRGNWTVRGQKLDTRGLESLVKRSLISNLIRFSDYNIVDLEEFTNIYGDSLNAIKPASGLKVKGIDAVLNLRFAVSVVNQNGEFDSVKSFSRRTSSKVGKKWKTTESTSTDRKVTEPYQTKTASIFLTGELVGVTNGKIELLSTFSEVSVVSLGSGFVPGSFNQEPKGAVMSFYTRDDRSKDEKLGNLPLFGLSHETIGNMPSDAANMARRIGVQISNAVLPKFSRFEIVVTRTIDTGGNDEAVEFLKRADVMKALEMFEHAISDPEQKTEENLYNLGICYEAIGEPQIARQYYEESLQLDEGYGYAIEALGSLENPT